jgi:hypothetical protein
MKIDLLTEEKERIHVDIPASATFADYMRVLKLIKLQMKTYIKRSWRDDTGD